jgi:hypothetical protein
VKWSNRKELRAPSSLLHCVISVFTSVASNGRLPLANELAKLLVSVLSWKFTSAEVTAAVHSFMH